MGRVHGFLGGVLLTSSITYLTALQFKQNQKTVCSSLKRSQDLILSRNDRDDTYVPGSNRITYTTRPFRESFVDIWNAEIIKGVNWLYGINWAAAGEKLERKLFED